jgi:hypothetical protein
VQFLALLVGCHLADEVVVIDSLKKGRRQGAETAVRLETRHRVIISEGGDNYTTQGCLRGHISNC